MVVPIRKLPNTLLPTIFKLQNDYLELSKWYPIDIETVFPKEHLISLSSNSSREVSVISDGFSMNYAEYVQVQANNMTWVKQVKNKEVHSPSLFNVSLKEIISDTVSMRSTVKSIYIPHIRKINCENASQGLRPYTRPINLQTHSCGIVNFFLFLYLG